MSRFARRFDLPGLLARSRAVLTFVCAPPKLARLCAHGLTRQARFWPIPLIAGLLAYSLARLRVMPCTLNYFLAYLLACSRAALLAASLPQSVMVLSTMAWMCYALSVPNMYAACHCTLVC